jgi:HAD superfamily hydrolase (TIGR01509 family)
MKLSNIKALIFDNDNTIAKIFPDPKTFWLDIFIKALKKCGGNPPADKEEELMVSYYRNDDFESKMKKMGVKCDFEQFQIEKGLTDENERIKTINQGNANLFKDAVTLFKWAEKNSIKVMVATFTTKNVVDAYFNASPEVKIPDAVFDWNLSLKTGLKKPHPDIVNTLLNPYSIKPSETIMVGDRLTDIETGNNAGCHTFLILRRNEDKEYIDIMLNELDKNIKSGNKPGQGKVPSCGQITSLTEILDFIC